jgi:hypothetical protein
MTHMKGKYGLSTTKPFTVTEKMYQCIKRAPKAYRSSNTNAYIFGRKYKLETYKFFGDHGNDSAQTGFIDIDLERKIPKEIWNNPIWEKTSLSWNRNDLKIVQKVNPAILWIGETVGGDIGASLYIHKNENNEIDGMIVDNFYFYQK